MKSTTLQPYWKTLKALLLSFLVAGTAFIMIFTIFLGKKMDIEDPLVGLAGIALINLTAFFIARAYLKSGAIQISFQENFLKLFLLQMAIFVPFLVLVDLLSYWINLPSYTDALFQESFEKNKGIHFLTTVVAAPITEELLFRGVFLNYLMAHRKKWESIVFTSLLFGLVHISPDQLFFGFLAGLFLGYTYIRTQNILVPIFFHALNNALSFLFMSENADSILEFFNS
jgi:uncharacterized protein